ncbi:MAG: DnaJ C-terminal domain-containing protein [Cyanobacteria bacterium P01_H01_bin.74]
MSVKYKDYYKILGVSRSASDAEIKSAYRKKARKLHPDVNPDGGEAFKELNEAYEALGDPKKRQLYDSLGANWRQGQNFNPPPGFDGVNMGGQFGNMGGFSNFFEMLFGAAAGQAGGAGFSGGQINLEDILSGYSGQAGQRQGYQQSNHRAQQQRQQRPPENLDIEQPLPLDLEDVFTGTQKEILTLSNKRMTVKIPKGVRPGQKIRLGGEGRRAGSRQGDLMLVVQYRSHPVFSVEDDVLVCNAAVPVPVLALGGDWSISTLAGKPLTLTIPQGTQPGTILRLKGQGLPDKLGKNPGDLLVRLKGIIPKTLTPREQELYQELRALQP